MADRFINWPPPKEALLPLIRTIARLMVQRDFDEAKTVWSATRTREAEPAEPPKSARSPADPKPQVGGG